MQTKESISIERSNHAKSLLAKKDEVQHRLSEAKAKYNQVLRDIDPGYLIEEEISEVQGHMQVDMITWENAFWDKIKAIAQYEPEAA